MTTRKNIFLTFIFLSGIFLQAGKVYAQDVTSKIAASIRSGNAKELSNYFNQTLDLSAPGSEGTFSKAQAEMIIKNFFVKYPPSSYSQNHQGKSNDGSQYAIGVYKSGNANFRTYFLLRNIGGKPLIHQLKFESEDD